VVKEEEEEWPEVLETQKMLEWTIDLSKLEIEYLLNATNSH
jgi:hypothetical protein